LLDQNTNQSPPSTRILHSPSPDYRSSSSPQSLMPKSDNCPTNNTSSNHPSMPTTHVWRLYVANLTWCFTSWTCWGDRARWIVVKHWSLAGWVASPASSFGPLLLNNTTTYNETMSNFFFFHFFISKIWKKFNKNEQKNQIYIRKKKLENFQFLCQKMVKFHPQKNLGVKVLVFQGKHILKLCDNTLHWKDVFALKMLWV
jgi:hypothetical protein